MNKAFTPPKANPLARFESVEKLARFGDDEGGEARLETFARSVGGPLRQLGALSLSDVTPKDMSSTRKTVTDAALALLDECDARDEQAFAALKALHHAGFMQQLEYIALIDYDDKALVCHQNDFAFPLLSMLAKATGTTAKLPASASPVTATAADVARLRSAMKKATAPTDGKSAAGGGAGGKPKAAGTATAAATKKK